MEEDKCLNGGDTLVKYLKYAVLCSCNNLIDLYL